MRFSVHTFTRVSIDFVCYQREQYCVFLDVTRLINTIKKIISGKQVAKSCTTDDQYSAETKILNYQMKPKGVTTQMKALHNYNLVATSVLLLKTETSFSCKRNLKV